MILQVSPLLILSTRTPVSELSGVTCNLLCVIHDFKINLRVIVKACWS